ncbi:hypothetical protein BLOT_002469 [Blomia tropicalis]|nr:hypothetical protein BLOT_002469 [Blomia tropicalis]
MAGQDWQYWTKTFISGGIAGMTSKTTVAPLDRIKILMQVHNSHYKNFGVFSGLYAIIRQESFLSLYKGNGAQMVRVFPYAAFQFMSFEIYKKLLNQITFVANNEGKVNHKLKFVAGSMAGVTSVLMTYPLDLVRARLASVVTPNASVVTLASDTMAIKAPSTIQGTIMHADSLVCTVGITPTILAMIPYGGCNFYMFERLKHWCVQYAPTTTCYRTADDPDKWILNIPSKLLCGGLSGAIGQTVIYPLDVARRRMQLSMTSKETAIYSKSFLEALVITYRSHGIVAGLYRGMSVNYIRAVPMVSVSFCTYEIMKQLMGLETGVQSK